MKRYAGSLGSDHLPPRHQDAPPAHNSGHNRRALIIVAVSVLLILVSMAGLVARQQFRSRPAASPSPASIALRPTIAVTAITATYGDPTLTLRATMRGEGTVVDEGAVTFALIVGERRIALPDATVADGVASATATMPSWLNAGTYPIEAAYQGTARFTAVQGTALLHVARARARVAFVTTELARTYDGTAKAVTAITDPPNLAVTVAYARGGAPIATPIAAGTYTVEATVGEQNYEGTTSATLVIDRATPALVWPSPAALTYGTPLGDAQLNATASTAGEISYDPPAGAILAAGGERALTATFTPADRDNYRAVTTSATVAVARAPLTVAADNQARPYGGPNPPLTVALRGFVNGESAAALKGAPVAHTEATAASPVGNYRIVVAAGDLATDNYAFTLVDGTLTVTKAPLTVTANEAARVYGAPDPPFGGTLAGVMNDDQIVVDYGTTAAAASPIGTYPIMANLSAPEGRLGNYEVVTVAGTLTIVPADVAPTLPTLAAHEGDTIILQARVTATAPSTATVDEGRVTFAITRDGVPLRTLEPLAVSGGNVSAAYPLGDFDAGEYIVWATYDGAQNFTPSVSIATLSLLNVAPTAVMVGPTAAVAEGATFTITLATPNDPSAADRAAGFTYAFDRGDGHGYGAPTAANAVTCQALDDPGLVVRARIFDQHGDWTEYALPVVIANVGPTLDPIAGPVSPVALGAPTAASAQYADPGVRDRHTGTWDWGDGTTTRADLESANGAGVASGTHTYTRPGIYAITLALSDDFGATERALLSYIVVDPADAGSSAGLVWFDSPAGAITATPAWVGPATLAFLTDTNVASTPQAQLQLAFEADHLRFTGTTATWLATGDARVQIEGAGLLNGSGGYRFLLLASDGQATGVPDWFRLVITERASGLVVYDSAPGAAIEATPLTVPASGDIVIHPRQRDRISHLGEAAGAAIAKVINP